jgi:predicted metalloprotease with PDZ domain
MLPMNNADLLQCKINYRLGYGSFGQFVKVFVTVNQPSVPILKVFIPAWRPGRYERGNFVRNIRHFRAFSESGNPLHVSKTSRETWQIVTQESTVVNISYEYYAVRPDAGSCWLDQDIFYVNPVHCCIGIFGKQHLPCSIVLDLPDDFIIATSLQKAGNRQFIASGFDELADSPILASPSLLHHCYEVYNHKFHVWFYGLNHVDREKIKRDFSAFTEVQIKTMNDFPVKEFHFLILALPFPFYHGVEHLKSTVIAIGPAEELMTEKLYAELIGVASHELFHVWNVKTIRPAEMLPYDFTRENYSVSGWVYEGITTYYGDLFLVRSGFFSIEAYFSEIAVRLQKHLDNPGKFNYSILESSFDTWVDGYEPGVPGRKTSIYDEGSLVALMFDLYIRQKGSGKTLDDFMRSLYLRFGKTHTGYTHEHLVSLLCETAGDESNAFFEKILNYRGSYLSDLRQLFKNLAVEILLEPNPLLHERKAGFRINRQASDTLVSVIQPDSPAEKAGLMHGDEIISMNEDSGFLILELLRFKRKKTIKINIQAPDNYFDKVKIVRSQNPTPFQEAAFNSWIKGLPA